jgi:hypothetical protein
MRCGRTRSTHFRDGLLAAVAPLAVFVLLCAALQLGPPS